MLSFMAAEKRKAGSVKITGLWQEEERSGSNWKYMRFRDREIASEKEGSACESLIR